MTDEFGIKDISLEASGYHSDCNDLEAHCERLTAALKAAREAIEKAPHVEGCCELAVWKQRCEQSDSFAAWNRVAPDCSCWKRDALARPST